jgi:hypothetical protein
MPNGTSNCGPGHLCAALMQGSPAVCVKLCQDDNPEGECAEGSSCNKVFDGFSETVGVCL